MKLRPVSRQHADECDTFAATNGVSPAAGDRLLAVARVKKSGRTLTVCEFEVMAAMGEERLLCACGLATLIRLADRPDRPLAD